MGTMNTKTIEKLTTKYVTKNGNAAVFSKSKKMPVSLRGILKGVKITEQDIRSAKKSLFRKTRT